jgi:mycofactocin biosynthesis protein MftB
LTVCAVSTEPTSANAGPPVLPEPEGSAFDPGLAYRCSPQVALRPESFGALVYHFGTRRLSFLKTRQLVDVVSGLDGHPDVHAAIESAGVSASQHPAYLRALAGLAANGTIEPRSVTIVESP